MKSNILDRKICSQGALNPCRSLSVETVSKSKCRHTVISTVSLKSDFNAVLFVIESRELLCKNIKITTQCILKKDFTHKKYLNDNYFRLLFSGFILMKVDTTLILAGCLDVTLYSLLRK